MVGSGIRPPSSGRSGKRNLQSIQKHTNKNTDEHIYPFIFVLFVHSFEMKLWAAGYWTVCELPDDLVDAVEVRLDLVDSLRQQPAIRSDAHVGHPVDRHQGFHQPAQRVEGGVTRLEEVEKN